jgi:O-antigen/teichoic acid export membrane protein
VAAAATHWRGESPLMALVLATLASVIPLLLLREFCRRLGFAHFWTGSVCLLDSSVAIGQGLSLTALVLAATLSAATAHLSAGLIAGIMAGVWLFHYRHRFHFSAQRVTGDWWKNWQQGKWLFAGQLVGVVHAYAVLWLLALLINKEATGIFTACATVVALSNPFLIGISNFLGPYVARSHSEQGPNGVRRVVSQSLAVLGGSMLVFCLVIFFLGSSILDFFFANQFPGQQATINVMALTFLASAVGMAADHGLRALTRSDVAFATSLGGMTVTVVAALLCIPPWGVWGAACAALCGSCVSSALRLFALVRLLTQESGSGSPTAPREVSS